jgi:putative FmdB family regulatory protein
MPLYEYECDACGRRFEQIQKFSDPPVETCPHCGGKVHKLLSSPAIQFKGTGWYVTDYPKKGSTSDGKSEASHKSGEASGKDDKGESKSETKSDAKSETKKETKSDSGKSDSAKT